MKNDKVRERFFTGLIAFAVIALGILFFFCLFKVDVIRSAAQRVIRILSPIIYGFVFAYLATPLYNFFRRKLTPFLEKRNNHFTQKHIQPISKSLSTTIVLILILLAVAGILAMVIPQLLQSIMGIIQSLPKYGENITNWIERVLENHPNLEQIIMNYYNEIAEWFQEWTQSWLIPQIQQLISGFTSSVLSTFRVLWNIIIGIIAAIYMINSKEKYIAQAKKIVYALLSEKNAKLVIGEIRLIHQTFIGFIVGKLIDSLIIAIITFICLSILRMPYTLLVTVIIGVTNIIPFFGPLIGAIPSVILIFLVSPIKSLYFLIYILIIQIFDGNILGPRILGNSTGLSSFWVLFSILLFGGLWGFVGMIIAVPLFAVIYHLTKLVINYFLRKKNMSTVTDDYYDK